MEKLEVVLSDYFTTWNNALVNKDADSIRSFMSKNFVGYWANSDINNPTPYYYDYDLGTVLQQMNDVEKKFHTNSITYRKNGNEAIVVGREFGVIGDRKFAAQCMLIWEFEEFEWKLKREYIELER
ncbi:DUF4440 domain-containing protein [Paenisporosarcina cavernae]|uniref:Nuclear transport factor 2 family protein n=1 Tax=Paenisporosarcina cavernae TaxID=2320858 RepID=A0A385YQE9_9BACL|nr:DUF4440 domain-containing protein [Paenisporosarcina cavernae]AYC28866.1 nuclear transport factor 2 family protein [Paenisporosarcina cavernae]